MTEPTKLLDGLGKCECACLLALELAHRAGVSIGAARIARLTGYSVEEVDVAVEALVGRGLAQRLGPRIDARGGE
jgi:hypothetical protein